MAITDEYGYAESPDERDYLAQPPVGPVITPPAGAPPPASTTPTDNWGGKNPIDPAYIRSVIAQWAAMPGADPSLGADPDYWLKRILETGGLRADNLKYWQDASVGPTAFFNNPNREGGSDKQGPVIDNGGTGFDDDWFSQNTPAPASYASLTRPDYLQGPYIPQQWHETFTAPTMEELQKDPGYLASEAAMQRGLEHSAAAKGSILSGGFIGRTLPRALSEHAGTAYKDLVGRAFDTYQSKYGAFMNNEALKAGARGINEGAFQADLGNNLNTYNTRYKSYRDTIGDSFDLAKLGLDAALGSRY